MILQFLKTMSSKEVLKGKSDGCNINQGEHALVELHLSTNLAIRAINRETSY
jgi:hypothetical protein